MSHPKVKYQPILITVDTEGQEIPIDVETDKLYNTVTGINAIITDDKGKFSLIELDINSREVFSENFEILRILNNSSIPPDFSYKTLREPAGGSKIKGKYVDVANGTTYPYRVSISLRLENIDSQEK